MTGVGLGASVKWRRARRKQCMERKGSAFGPFCPLLHVCKYFSMYSQAKTLECRRFAIKALAVGGFAWARSQAQKILLGARGGLWRREPAVKVAGMSWFTPKKSCQGATSMSLIGGSLDQCEKFMPGHVVQKHAGQESEPTAAGMHRVLGNDWRRWPLVSTQRHACANSWNIHLAPTHRAIMLRNCFFGRLGSHR